MFFRPMVTHGAMSYHWSEEHGKFSFNLDRDVPYVLGANAQIPVGNLLKPFGLKVRHIDHWIIHSGGKKVIDAGINNFLPARVNDPMINMSNFQPKWFEQISHWDLGVGT